MPKLIAKVDTLLKQSPADSSQIPKNKLISIKAGTEVKYSWIKRDAGHYLISLVEPQAGFYNWYAFIPHFTFPDAPSSTNTVSENALALLMEREGFAEEMPDGRVKSYWDALGGIWTIGYGTTYGVTADTIYTKEECMAAKQRDLAKFRDSVLEITRGMELYRHQIDALTLFAYNCGSAGLEESSLMAYLRSTPPAKYNKATVRELFGRWNKSGSPLRPTAGLSIRQMMQAELFFGDDWKVWTGDQAFTNLIRLYGSAEAAGVYS